MPDKRQKDGGGSRCVGIVLAGGASRRMGQNKALLTYKGRPLVEHMADILIASGVPDVLISGDVEGYDSIPDVSPFAGPAQAIYSVMQQYPDYEGYLFVPVDMPLLSPEALKYLRGHSSGAYFTDWPLPVYIRKMEHKPPSHSVKDMLDANQVPHVPLPLNMIAGMVNVNTPQEWNDILEQA